MGPSFLLASDGITILEGDLYKFHSRENDVVEFEIIAVA
jgi:hypothetical protein